MLRSHQHALQSICEERVCRRAFSHIYFVKHADEISKSDAHTIICLTEPTL